jgi:pimeloyl-ACP methyl ester carboxylesterase
VSGPLPGVSLYHEVRGSGPVLLLIAGATGDAGHFARLADLLADAFTVVTYDRPGNGRSPAADPAAAAAIAAQADAAAEIIRAAGGSAVVVGFSSGGLIALELLARHRSLVRGAVVHEPALLALAPAAPERMRPVIELAARDLAAALETFFRMNTSDAAWERMDPSTRERMVGSAGNLFQHEYPAVASYVPDEAALRAVTAPVHLLVSAHGLPHAPHVQRWLQERLPAAAAGTVDGSHAPYLDQPDTFAAELRPLLLALGG